MGVRGVTADGHSFQDRMGIGLQNGAIHEGARVALIPVADDIFRKRGIAPSFLPFLAGREPRASTAPQAGEFYFFNHLPGFHGGEDFRECGISVSCNIFINIFRIDQASISKRP